jgi:hypothetical protein
MTTTTRSECPGTNVYGASNEYLAIWETSTFKGVEKQDS